MSIKLGGEHLTMKGTGLVQINSKIKMWGTGTELPVKIEADFSKVPHHLHSLYLNSLVAQYNVDVNIHSNIGREPEPMTIKEKKSEWRLNRIVDIISKAIRK
jgi:hypothetical protein